MGKQGILSNVSYWIWVDSLSEEIGNTIQSGHKVVLCENGGLTSDVLHFAGEIVGHFQEERNVWSVFILNVDVATMITIAKIMDMMMYLHGKLRDTSSLGSFLSGSVLEAIQNASKVMELAKAKGVKTAAFLGKDGSKIGRELDYAVIVPCKTTTREQERLYIMDEIKKDKLG